MFLVSLFTNDYQLVVWLIDLVWPYPFNSAGCLIIMAHSVFYAAPYIPPPLNIFMSRSSVPVGIVLYLLPASCRTDYIISQSTSFIFFWNVYLNSKGFHLLFLFKLCLKVLTKFYYNYLEASLMVNILSHPEFHNETDYICFSEIPKLALVLNKVSKILL